MKNIDNVGYGKENQDFCFPLGLKKRFVTFVVCVIKKIAFFIPNTVLCGFDWHLAVVKILRDRNRVTGSSHR